MKRIIQIFILIVVCNILFASNIHALPLQFGVKGGVTSSKFSWSDIDNNSALVGYQAGVFARIHLLGLALQPEVLYTTVGDDLSTLDYIQVPVNLQFGINIAGIRPFVQAGPYWSYAINNSGELDFDILKRNDWGFGVGFGVDLFKHIHVAFKYDWGVENLVKDNNQISGTLKNRVYNFSLGYIF